MATRSSFRWMRSSRRFRFSSRRFERWLASDDTTTGAAHQSKRPARAYHSVNDEPQLPVTIATDEKSQEIRLLARLASGDMDAAADLYDQFAGRVFALARRIL